MPPENRTDNSRPEQYWKFIQFGFVRIIIAMGAGFIIATLLNPEGANCLIEIIHYDPYSLSNLFQLDETWVLLGFGTGLIIFGILLYTFMYLAEYRFKLLLQRFHKINFIILQKKQHSLIRGIKAIS